MFPIQRYDSTVHCESETSLGFEKPWWFCASSDASPRNEVNLLFFDPLAKEERTLPHHVTREVGP